MKVLGFNKINGLENEIDELIRLAKATKRVIMYEIYFVVIESFKEFTNRKITEMENLEEHTVNNHIKNYKAKGINLPPYTLERVMGMLKSSALPKIRVAVKFI